MLQIKLKFVWCQYTCDVQACQTRHFETLEAFVVESLVARTLTGSLECKSKSLWTEPYSEFPTQSRLVVEIEICKRSLPRFSDFMILRLHLTCAFFCCTSFPKSAAALSMTTLQSRISYISVSEQGLQH